MKDRVAKLIIPALLSICFILFTAIVSQSDYSLTSFGRFCFVFHTIPSDDGFLNGEDFLIVLYYVVFWVMLTLLFAWIGHLVRRFIL